MDILIRNEILISESKIREALDKQIKLSKKLN